MDFLGGLMKGFKPLMDATGVKPDDSMQLAILQGEVTELENKKRDALADIGQAAYDMVMKNSLDAEKFLPLCKAADDAELLLQNKKAEYEKANEAFEKKKKEEEEKLAARTCPNCGQVNEEGTRFCSSCGTKMEIQKPKESLCKACGAKLDPNCRFCGECGARVENNEPTEVKCSSCGKVFTAGTKFCDQCGSRL